MNIYHVPWRPLRWLMRIRHRCGYGIHSPFAFGFVQSVVFEAGSFYAYPRLDALWAGARREGQTRLRRKDVRLLFRLSNFAQARRGLFCGLDADGVALAALREGCRKTHWSQRPEPGEKAGLIVLGEGWEPSAEMWLDAWAEGGTLVVFRPHRTAVAHRAWQALCRRKEAQVWFDLYDFGILFYKPQLQRQGYLINYR